MKIGFIGAGNMARAIASGLVSKGQVRGEDLTCISATGQGAKLMAQKTGARIATSKQQLIAESDILVLAFKPQHLETITLAEAQAATGKLVISVLAGRDLDSLSQAIPQAANHVRVMPNTPAQIGQGVSTYCFLNAPSESQSQIVADILGSLGAAYQVREDQLPIATVINGCGPAFYFRIIQLLGQIAAKYDLDSELAIKLATQTGIGSLQLLRQSQRDPQDLIDEVVSPNGVTHALLASLDRNALPQILDTATQDALKRSDELARNA